VARHAAVSAQTVSRFFRNPAQVSPDTAARIDASVRAIGYVPNLIAGALASNRSGIVAVLVPTIANPIHAAPVQALSDALRPAGYQVLVGSTNYDPAVERDLVLTGTSLTAESARTLTRSGVPVVQMWELPDHPVDMAVGSDNEGAGVAVARHLFERGYRNLAVLSHAAAGDTRSAARLRGFVRETERLGLHAPYSSVFTRSTDIAQAPALLARLRAARPTVDAVFCVGDPLGIGLVLACQRAGVRIPDELAIAAFGDSDLAALITPSLTTVSVPRADFGRIAGEMLLRRFAGLPMERKVVDLGFRLVARETT
jgi:LacI family gluconate utilization system Gnt-I transcriptional repressor